MSQPGLILNHRPTQPTDALRQRRLNPVVHQVIQQVLDIHPQSMVVLAGALYNSNALMPCLIVCSFPITFIILFVGKHNAYKNLFGVVIEKFFPVILFVWIV
jgi:hypothetical protein